MVRVLNERIRAKLSTGCSIFDLTLQVATVFSSVVLDVGGRIVDPDPGVIDPVGTGRVHSPEVTVHPRHGGDENDPESAHG